MKRLELGVFLPVAKGGFVLSRNSPPYQPSYLENLRITRLAEDAGLDYVFSMAKWRGFGGQTHFWDASLESITLMSGLAAATSRISLIATVNPLLYHPAVIAKMSATIADISGGRLGLNIITGAAIEEYTQMGVLPPDYDRDRYRFATEWVQVLKRLWTEPSVTHHGQYFQLDGCVSEPKPMETPFLVCAATSEEGFRFTAKEADYSFLKGASIADTKAASLRAKEIATEENNSIMTATTVTIVVDDSESAANDYWQHLIDGADVDAITNAGTITSRQSRKGAQTTQATAMLADPRRQILAADRLMLGSPDDVAGGLAELAIDGDIDSIMLVFADYVTGLERFSTDVLPRLRQLVDVGDRRPSGVMARRDDADPARPGGRG